ncbi:MAG TPA: hypothetical protein VFM02_01810 [Candidatus Paceibacterota bacterium]|nr:hypothetical protein [Candidatus Paceibacterota bacterium]
MNDRKNYLIGILCVLLVIVGGLLFYVLTLYHNQNEVLAENKNISQENISTSTQSITAATSSAEIQTVSGNRGDALDPWIFMLGGEQIVLKGDLMPVSIQTYYDKDVRTSIRLRCWKEKKLCAYSLEPEGAIGIHGESLQILSVKSWSQNEILLEGEIGGYSNCMHEGCSTPLTVTISIPQKIAKFVEFTPTMSATPAPPAQDTYVLVGDGDGVHHTWGDIPPPEVHLVPLS